MRKSKEEAAETRARIIRKASKEFNQHGIAGTGLADVRKSAGLTHGGFYKHFQSKDELVAEALEEGLDANEEGAQAGGVKHVSVPDRSTRSEERRKLQKRRWFKQGQKRRSGCEGRIGVVKRRHGLDRCCYRGLDGMRRWVGLGVIADNLINIGRRLAPQPA